MKKFVSLLLAAVMLLSCTAAMAEDDTSGKAFVEAFDVRETDDRWTGTDVTSINTPKTELWLQVDASGQIDVTVPLVLVFKTNIDGGAAQEATNYKITNNSSSDLLVTGITVSKEGTNAASQPMTMVAYSTSKLEEDNYKAQLSVADSVEKGKKDKTALTGAWDLYTNSHTNDAINGGLFELEKAATDGTGTNTAVIVDMATGRLSFVTSRSDSDAIDTNKGVKLLTVTYTVAIDTSDAIGSAITDNGDSTVNGTDAETATD